MQFVLDGSNIFSITANSEIEDQEYYTTTEIFTDAPGEWITSTEPPNLPSTSTVPVTNDSLAGMTQPLPTATKDNGKEHKYNGESTEV